MRKANKESGFTLIEITIVIAVIALIIGGILAGVHLVRASKIRSLSTDLETYKSAINAFEEKYDCMPGDCLKITDYFGVQDSTPATCQTTASTGTLTCNGNGNGRVDDSTYEMFRFWQHLAIAGFIKGKFTGVAGSGSNAHHIADENTPSAAFLNTAFGFSYINFPAGDLGTYGLNYGHIFWIGAILEGGNNRPQFVFMRPSEALAFDLKTDDGKPGTGLVIARSFDWSNADNCMTGANATDFTGSYNIASDYFGCAFMVRLSKNEY